MRSLLDEIFGKQNFVSQITFKTTTGKGGLFLDNVSNFILWFAKDREKMKYRQMYFGKMVGGEKMSSYVFAESQDTLQRRRLTNEEKLLQYIPAGWDVFSAQNMTSQSGGEKSRFPVSFQGKSFVPRVNFWKTNETGMSNLIRANRIVESGRNINYIRYQRDFTVTPIDNNWRDTAGAGYAGQEKIYTVQTHPKVIQRCVLMSTDPGDLVIDPTCGSGTTAYVCEQFGRRWIVIDTSRVALALARARMMGAQFPYYQLADKEGLPTK